MPDLSHADVRKMVGALAETGAVNLDTSIGKLMESVGSALPDDPEGTSFLQVLCCHGFFLVTKDLTARGIDEVRQQAPAIRDALG